MACEGSYFHTLPRHERSEVCDVINNQESCYRFPLKQMVAKALQNPRREGMYVRVQGLE